MNVEVDLASFHGKRAICERCLGAGWMETGDDRVGFPDIELSPEGYPRWVTSYAPREDVAGEDVSGGNLLAP